MADQVINGNEVPANETDALDALFEAVESFDASEAVARRC